MNSQIQTAWQIPDFKIGLSNYMLRKSGNFNKRNVLGPRIHCAARKQPYPGDLETMKSICKILNLGNQTIDENESHRSFERCEAIVSFVDKCERYLDYGCGDASITMAVSRYYNLTPESTLAVDIVPVVSKDLTFMYDASSVENESLDLVTAMVSLHHVVEVDRVLGEISRILRTGGKLVIREHDNNNEFGFSEFLNSIHIYSDVASTGTCNIDNLINSTTYRSREEWTKKICENGFLENGFHEYGGRNPQRLYYACYVKC